MKILVHFALLLQFPVQHLRHTTGAVNTVRLSQLVDNTNRWSLFTT